MGGTGAYEQWRANIFPNNVLTELRMPDQFDAAGEMVDLANVDKMVHISSDTSEHAYRLHQYVEMGFDQLTLHNVNLNHPPFIDAFGERVLPHLLKPALA